MKIGSFTTPNDKGQIVIPKVIRDALGINTHVTLNVSIAGKGILIYPVEEFLTKEEGENSYIKLLEKTKGSWKGEDWDSLRKVKSNVELGASKARKKSW